MLCFVLLYQMSLLLINYLLFNASQMMNSITHFACMGKVLPKSNPFRKTISEKRDRALQLSLSQLPEFVFGGIIQYDKFFIDRLIPVGIIVEYKQRTIK